MHAAADEDSECCQTSSRLIPVGRQSAEQGPSDLRIGMVSSFMPPHLGGLETVTQALFNIYKSAGLEVRWVTSRVPVTAPTHEGGCIRVRCWNGLENYLGVPWPIWGPGGMREVARLVRWADVLHVQDCLYFTSALTVLFARRVGKPVLLSQHIGFVPYRSMLLNGLEHLAYRTLGRVVLRSVSRIVFWTAAAEQFVTTLLGRRPGAASTIPYGIDIERFRPPTPDERVKARLSLGLPEASCLVLFVGRLVEKKGPDLFMEVCRQRPSCHFLMVGDGLIRPVARDNLTWLPFVPAERMEQVYQAADVFLLPSRGEGFPLAVLEAMATGLPVIVVKGEAFTSVLERESACLPAERTSFALCKALDHLREAPGLAAAIASRSRELVVREWSIEAMGARYLRLIRDLAGKC